MSTPKWDSFPWGLEEESKYHPKAEHGKSILCNSSVKISKALANVAQTAFPRRCNKVFISLANGFGIHHATVSVAPCFRHCTTL